MTAAQVLLDGGDGCDSFQLTLDPNGPSSVVVNTDIMDVLTVKSTQSTVLHSLEHLVSIQAGQSVVTAAVPMRKLSVFSAASYITTTDLVGELEVQLLLMATVVS